MLANRIQRNSSIGSREAKTAARAAANSNSPQKTGFWSGRRFRQLAGVMLLAACTFSAISRPSPIQLDSGIVAAHVAVVEVQRADIIDDIIDAIDKILNPPPPPPPNP